MIIVCPRCEDLGENILSAEKVNKLCEKCGNSLIRVDDVLVEKTIPVERSQVEPPPGVDKTVPGDLPSSEEVEQMTVKVLRKLAKKLGVETWWNKRQEDLIEDVKAFLA